MTPHRAWWPAPWLSAALLAGWLMLHVPPGPGDVLIGLFLAWLMPRLALRLVPRRPRLRHPATVLALMGTAIADQARSALQLGWAIVRHPSKPVTGQLVTVPLTLRNPYGLAVLQVLTTYVPGTIWCEWNEWQGTVLLHVANVTDVEAFIADYQQRYEAPLKRIFE